MLNFLYFLADSADSPLRALIIDVNWFINKKVIYLNLYNA